MNSDIAPSRESILQQALALNPTDRAYVADELERSFPQATFASEEIATAWSEEIDRRIAAFDNGKTKALDLDCALKHVNEAFEDHRSRRLQT